MPVAKTHDNSTDNSRSVLIDVLKGIGIILVVLGHITFGDQLVRKIIFSFHMPLFFFLSGVVTRNSDSKKSAEEVSKIFKRTYVPYIVFLLLDLFFQYFFFHEHSIVTLAKNFLVSAAGIELKSANAPLWFLFSLFLCKLIFYFIGKIKPLLIASFIGSFIFIFVYVYFDLTWMKPVLYCWTVPAWFFFTAGYFLKKYVLEYEKYFKLIVFIPVFIISVILYCLLFRYSSTVSMKDLIIDNPFLYYANSFLGMYIIFFISDYISKIKPVASMLCYLGKNSIYILIYHYYLARRIFPAVINAVGLGDYLYSPLTITVLFVLIMIIMLPAIYISDKYLYFIFGRKKKSAKANQR